MNQSHEIIDIIADAVGEVSGSVEVVMTGYDGEIAEPEQPDINYIFGSAEYFKDYLDEAMRIGKSVKFPLVLLFCPIHEMRNDPKHYSTAKINLLIACNTFKEWNNEQRKVNSFERILRPIYNRLMEALTSDLRLDFGYRENIKHEYSENYSYGKYGAYVDRSGEMVSEPIDAIDIRNLEIKVNKLTCR